MRRASIILVFLFSLAALRIQAQELSMNAKLLTVYNLVGSEQYALALFQIDEILAEDSTTVNAYIFGGLCYQNLGDKEDAMHYYNKALYYEPENADVHYLMGECLISLKKLEEAEESFNKALYYKPDYYKAYIELAKIDRQRKNYVEAEKKLVHVVKNQIYNLEGYKELSKLFIDIQDTALALNVISQALMIQPGDMESLEFRIGILFNLKIYEGMLADLDQYIELDDKDADMYYKRGFGHLITGDTISALRDFNDAIYLNKDLSEAYYYRAITRNALFDMEGACKDILVAKEKNFLPSPELAARFCQPVEANEEVVEEENQE